MAVEDAQARRDRIITLAAAGLSIDDIAEDQGIHPQTVRKHLRAAGHPTPNQLAARRAADQRRRRRAYLKRKEFGSTWVRCASCGRRGRTNRKVLGRSHVVEKCAECQKDDL